ncbi:uncharacterized protein Dwil_GK27093 [Drosophila willistoni]|uniref:Uncharacterized protein n=1 Tax=Drosophila willistoni TaxID=7260 RepID=A0A0Q9WUB9_DROWI|nr:uncharacterized protein Dwil_GK27093 [Drosophila willistoni]
MDPYSETHVEEYLELNTVKHLTKDYDSKMDTVISQSSEEKRLRKYIEYFQERASFYRKQKTILGRKLRSLKKLH